MRVVRSVIVVVSAAALAACAHTTNVPLRPNFAAELKPGQALANVSPAMTFVRGEYADRRPDPTRLAQFKQGIHTYTLREERPLADVLYEGLASVLTTSRQRWGEGAGDIRVNLTFLNLSAARNAGMVNVGATASVQIKADFVNAGNGNLIYSNVYSGSDERSQAMVGGMGMVLSSIDAAITRSIQSIADDAALAAALARPR